jgi:hypothetical protein
MEWKAYRGSKSALSLVAFYADCQHTLTYNLLVRGDISRPEGDEGTIWTFDVPKLPCGDQAASVAVI